MEVVAVLLGLGLLAALGLAFALEREMRLLARQLGCGRTKRRPVRVALCTRGSEALAREINELADEGERVRLDAAEERRALQENLAAFSHDVRTPLAGAQGYLQLYGVADSPAERDECVATATERLGAMRGLVDALFEYAKADDGSQTLAREPVDVGAVVADCLAHLYPAFAERGWEPAVALAEGVVVEADREALGRIVENLLANCLRHGSAAPTIVLRCSSDGNATSATASADSSPVGTAPAGMDSVGMDSVGAGFSPPAQPGATAATTTASSVGAGFSPPAQSRPTGGLKPAPTKIPSTEASPAATSVASFALEVSNPADGLDSLDAARLFDRFYRGDAARRAGGSGLGLAIAARLAEAQGLSLKATVTDNRFTIALAARVSIARFPDGAIGDADDRRAVGFPSSRN